MTRGIHIDITERKRKEEEIRYLGYHDQLTGLYNRRFYEEELLRLDVKMNLPLTIARGDVNGLKFINDSFGHDSGDELLKKVTKSLQTGCRADDIWMRRICYFATQNGFCRSRKSHWPYKRIIVT